MNKFSELNLIVFFILFVHTNGDQNVTEVKSVSDLEPKSDATVVEVLSVVSDKSLNGRAMKDNSNNMLEKSKRSEQKSKENLRKDKDMYDILRLHQTFTNNDQDKQFKQEQEKKEKGKLQTVGGVVGEIIAVIVSEVVKLFGNMVSDVAREVTAHGFVSVFKQFTDLTGISLPEM